MAAKIPITINEKQYEVMAGQTVYEACRDLNIDVPVLCHFEGLTDVGACRLCLVEVEGYHKLLPSCTTKVAPNMTIRTQTEKLQQYRRMIVELFFSERNHMCSVCVANQNCELQDLAHKVGMDHVRFPYLFQKCEVDTSHKFFVMDHNRCVMCTRCVRVCDELEGAQNWDVMNRGYEVRIIADFDQPWGQSTTCTSCGKCMEICPTGALWSKAANQGQMIKKPESIRELIQKRGINQ